MLPLILAAVGAAKAATVDQDRENRQRKLAATAALNSPWSEVARHYAVQPIQEADVIGGAMQGAGSGMGLQQNMNESASMQKMRDAQIEAIKNGGGAGPATYRQRSMSPISNPYSAMTVSGGNAPWWNY